MGKSKIDMMKIVIKFYRNLISISGRALVAHSFGWDGGRDGSMAVTKRAAQQQRFQCYKLGWLVTTGERETVGCNVIRFVIRCKFARRRETVIDVGVKFQYCILKFG